MSIDDISSEQFRTFAASLKRAREKYGDLKEEDVTTLQQSQVERLVDLEVQFRQELLRSSVGPKVYKKFLHQICTVDRNVLAARPYFRERQKIFTAHISQALKDGNWKVLGEFHINWKFISFANRAAQLNKKLRHLIREIEKNRWALVEINLPLVISRSRIFWSRTPQSHLTFLDFVQLGTEGLVAAIDKFCLPYTKVFRSVAIGRMVGNFIEHYSETVLHFYPSDRRKIYRANKHLSKNIYGAGNMDILGVTKSVNEGVEDNKKTSSQEIAHLLAAASVVSSDTKAPGDEFENVPDNISRYEAPEESRPDVQVERAELMHSLRKGILSLSMGDRKMLRLMGVDIQRAFG